MTEKQYEHDDIFKLKTCKDHVNICLQKKKEGGDGCTNRNGDKQNIHF